MDEQRFEDRLVAALEDEDRGRAFRDLAWLYVEADDQQRERLRSGRDFGKKWAPPPQEDLARRIPGPPPERCRAPPELPAPATGRPVPGRLPPPGGRDAGGPRVELDPTWWR